MTSRRRLMLLLFAAPVLKEWIVCRAGPCRVSSYAEEEQRKPEATLADTDKLAEANESDKEFRGEVTSQMRKMAGSKGLTREEIAEIERGANDFVNEALQRPGDLPNPSPLKFYSEACKVMVDGLPLIGSRQQRCCNVADIQGLKRPDGGVPELLPGVGLPPKGLHRDRLLQAEGREGGDGGLPAAVVKTEATGGVKDEGLACFPSFVIAGTQKSGTTALAGKGVYGVIAIGIARLPKNDPQIIHLQ